MLFEPPASAQSRTLLFVWTSFSSVFGERQVGRSYLVPRPTFSESFILRQRIGLRSRFATVEALIQRPHERSSSQRYKGRAFVCPHPRRQSSPLPVQILLS